MRRNVTVIVGAIWVQQKSFILFGQSFLPDVERDEEENRLREKLRQVYLCLFWKIPSREILFALLVATNDSLKLPYLVLTSI